MPAGLEVFDSNGVLSVSLTDRLSRYVGSFSTGINDGSIYHGQTAPSQVFIHASIQQGTGQSQMGACPTISINDQTISWAFGDTASSERKSITVDYWVY